MKIVTDRRLTAKRSDNTSTIFCLFSYIFKSIGQFSNLLATHQQNKIPTIHMWQKLTITCTKERSEVATTYEKHRTDKYHRWGEAERKKIAERTPGIAYLSSPENYFVLDFYIGENRKHALNGSYSGSDPYILKLIWICRASMETKSKI